ncbi:dynamin family protein [Arthrobacter sp. B1805]|uniref:dynamin family protein n=1 Tax=Arthrobacter sp. B1805 TaxID=2058892 RepID=UPI000CE47BFD|nr:dynamin family protein [Arthrobacter sp. B1805]
MSRHRGAVAETPLATSLTDALERLQTAYELGRNRLPEDALERLHGTLDRAGSRRSLSADHTVVGVFGPTGSGKSSLVNALSGTASARVAARRPTTSEPLALVWGAKGSGELLDWLGVTQRVELPDGAPLITGWSVDGGTRGHQESRDASARAVDNARTATMGEAQAGGRTDPQEPARRGLFRWRRTAAASTANAGKGAHRPGAAATSASSLDHADAAGSAGRADSTQVPGLILLDLPDFDSTAAAHREIVQRMAGQVDVLLWVVDPQKYADAALHHGFLRGLATHEAVTLIALNQADRLEPHDLDAVTGSLADILAGEGLPGVAVLPVSARTGIGVPALADEIRSLAESRAAATRRLAADASLAAAELLPFTADRPVDAPSQQARAALSTDLAAAAGVPVVVDAVTRAYRRDAHAVTGWPVTRWLARFRPDPLRRLNLRRDDVLPELRSSSLPLVQPAQGARVDHALRVFGDSSASGAVEPWHSSIRDAARGTATDLKDALDAAITGTDLETGRRGWWGLFGVLQWIMFVAFAAGLAWLGVLAVLGFLQLPTIDVPRIEGFPLPTLLILGGLSAGVLLSVLAALLARWGAARRAARVRRRLLASCAQVVHGVVVQPVGNEIERCNGFRAAVLSALQRS